MPEMLKTRLIQSSLQMASAFKIRGINLSNWGVIGVAMPGYVSDQVSLINVDRIEVSEGPTWWSIRNFTARSVLTQPLAVARLPSRLVISTESKRFVKSVFSVWQP